MITLKTLFVLWCVVAIQAVQLGHWPMLGLAAIGVFSAVMEMRTTR